MGYFGLGMNLWRLWVRVYVDISTSIVDISSENPDPKSPLIYDLQYNAACCHEKIYTGMETLG